MAKPRMAGKATRERLRSAGVDPTISEKEGLTVDEANQALRELKESQQLEALRIVLREIEEPEADNPELTLQHAEALVDDAEFEIVCLRCGDPPSSEDYDHMEILPVTSGCDNIEIVGESYHMKALRTIYKSSPKNEGTGYAWAVLVPEPDNRHDSNAVAVYIDGEKVGHLCREDAEYCQLELLELHHDCHTLLAVPATIHQGTSGKIGVELAWEIDEIPDATAILEARQKAREDAAEAEKLARDIEEERERLRLKQEQEREREEKRQAKLRAREEKRQAKLRAREIRRLNPPPPMTARQKRALGAILGLGALWALVVMYWLLERMDFF